MTGELLQELRRGTDKADIVSIAFNANASMLASTSDKGTVHIFKLNERVHDNSGAAAASSPSAAASSSSASNIGAARSATSSVGGGSGTPTGGDDASGGGHNPGFGLKMKGILPKYFSSEWSFSQFRVPDARSIVAFGNEPNTIISE